MKKVAVLMSGGVDSSTTAYLLVKQGYNVVGVTLKLWECNKLTETQKQLCCSPKDVYDAKIVCSQLGIDHYVLDLSSEFEKYIINKFCEKYINGFTPNPCVDCNNYIKFGFAFNKLKSLLNIDYISSGHYAKIVRFGKKYFIVKGVDKLKEQSYFLCQVSPELLPNIIFPLGNYTKSEVRKIATKANLKVAYKKESFDICFIPDGDYRKFLSSKGYKVYDKGKIIDIQTGKFLGYHKGFPNYTIGQRNMLGLQNLQQRIYVVKIEPKTNTIYVGSEDYLYSSSFFIQNCVFYEDVSKVIKMNDLYVKIRYKSAPLKCKICFNGDTTKVVLTETKAKAVTKGQYAVVYDSKERIILSGEIC